MRQQASFRHEHSLRRSEDLREVLDEAAVVLAGGLTRVRELVEDTEVSPEAADAAKTWSMQVHELSERLALRLPNASTTVGAYERATEALAAVAEAVAAEPRPQNVSSLMGNAEAERAAFLASARTTMAETTETRH